MKIAVDLDEVLGELVGTFLPWYNAKHGTSWGFEHVTDYHWENFMGISTPELIDEFFEFTESGMYASLPVIPEAIDAIEKLAAEHELVVVTSRQYAQEEITRTWLAQHFPGKFQDVVLGNYYAKDGTPSVEKGKLCLASKCQVLIDDDPKHVSSALSHGVAAILITKPWNIRSIAVDGSHRVADWVEAVHKVAELTKRGSL